MLLAFVSAFKAVPALILLAVIANVLIFGRVYLVERKNRNDRDA